MAWQRRKEDMAIAFRSRALFSLGRQGLRSCEAFADLCCPELFFLACFSHNSVLPNGQMSIAVCDSQSAQQSGDEHQALAELLAIAWFHPKNILPVSKGLKKMRDCSII